MWKILFMQQRQLLAGKKRPPFSKNKIFKKVQFLEVYTIQTSFNANKYFFSKNMS